MTKFYIMLLVASAFFLSGCYFLDHTSFPNTANIEYREYEFAKGLIRICLPPYPNYNMDDEYEAFLYSRWTGSYILSETGDYGISKISVLKDVKVPQDKDALMVRKRKEIVAPDKFESNMYRICRDCYIYSSNPSIKYKVVLYTSCGKDDFSTEAERNKRLGIDDEIFDKVINSIRIKNKDGEWIKPPIIKLDDEVWKDGVKVNTSQEKPAP